MATKSKTSRGVTILLMTSVLFVSGLLFDYMPEIIDGVLKRKIELSTNLDIASVWMKPPVDFHSYYWLYDITNVEQFLAGEKVAVRKVGPYHFTSQLEKKIVDHSANLLKITYNTTRHVRINDSQTDALLDEPLRLLNPIYASTLEGARQTSGSMPPDTKSMVYTSVQKLMTKCNEHLIMNLTGREALVGRQVEFIIKTKKLIENFGLDIKLPETLNGFFGYVAVMNETLQGPFEIYTGYRDSWKELGNLISFKGKRRATEYEGSCNRIQASVGELRPMPILDGQVLEIYQPSICRIVRLKPTWSRRLREGVAVNYQFAEEDWQSAAKNRENSCYCINNTYTNDNYCSLNGAIELAPCSYYSPIVMTVSNVQPDQRILSSISNYEPELLSSELDFDISQGNAMANSNDQKQGGGNGNELVKAKTQFLILKRIGVPIFGDVTLTLFMKVVRDANFRQTANVPEVSYVPLVMVRETATIPPKLAQVIINLENFLLVALRMKVVLYLTAIILLCYLTTHFYTSTPVGRDRVSPEQLVATTASANNSLVNINDPTPINNNHTSSGAAAANSANSNLASNLHLIGGSVMGDNKKAANPAADLADLDQRANSADSNRSLPPSRAISRGSLEEMELSLPPQSGLVGDVGVGGGGGYSFSAADDDISSSVGNQLPTNARGGNKSQLVTGTAGAQRFTEDVEAGNQSATQTNEEPTSRRIFSKVDELKGNPGKTTGVNNSNHQVEARKRNGSVASNGINNNDAEALDASANDPATSQGAINRPTATNRNWFMKVCSNFVRLLNGIRSSIKESNSLTVADEVAAQEKQLDMLAGKIDNWYSNAMTEEDQESPSPSSARGAGFADNSILASADDSQQERITKLTKKIQLLSDNAGQGNGNGNGSNGNVVVFDGDGNMVASTLDDGKAERRVTTSTSRNEGDEGVADTKVRGRSGEGAEVVAELAAASTAVEAPPEHKIELVEDWELVSSLKLESLAGKGNEQQKNKGASSGGADGSPPTRDPEEGENNEQGNNENIAAANNNNNSKSDTSLDGISESQSVIGVEDNNNNHNSNKVDKARALEQIELALESNGTGSNKANNEPIDELGVELRSEGRSGEGKSGQGSSKIANSNAKSNLITTTVAVQTEADDGEQVGLAKNNVRSTSSSAETVHNNSNNNN